MYILQDMLCVGGLGVVFYVPNVFTESLCWISAGLTYICSVASFTRQFIYSASVVVLCRVMVFRFGLLLECIRAFE
jgi:hypothetical protein